MADAIEAVEYPITQGHRSNDQLGKTILGQQRQSRSKDTPPGTLQMQLKDCKVPAPVFHRVSSQELAQVGNIAWVSPRGLTCLPASTTATSTTA